MANWIILKAAIANVIKTNGNQEITGQLLQNVLNNIISSVGENATFAGIATPATNPGVPDGPVFYFATTPGIYYNFGGIEIKEPGLVILYSLNDSWKSIKLYECLQQLGDSDIFPMSQKAITAEINKLVKKDSITQELGENPSLVMSQKAITAEINKLVKKDSITQELGDSSSLVMSQKIVTTEINKLVKKDSIIVLSEEEYEALSNKDKDKFYFVYE